MKFARIDLSGDFNRILMGNNFGILFDLDGTLVDNEHLKARAFSEAIEQLGGESSPLVYKDVMGMGGLKIRRHFAKRANIHVGLDEYAKLYKCIYQDLIKTELVIKPGVIPFIAELKSKKIKLVIVSGAYRDSVLYIINALNLGHYFDFVMTGDDVAKKKPDPESYIVALGKMALLREHVIVFEDAESGLKAADSAGLTSIGIRHVYNLSHDLSNAFNVYDSYESDFENMKKDINIIYSTNLF